MNTVEALEKIIEWHSDEEHAPGWDPVHHHCMYLYPPTGGRCAVGCLLPDDILDKVHTWGMDGQGVSKAEGQTAGRMMQIIPEAALLFEDVDVGVLEMAQQAHDVWAEGKPQWKQNVEESSIDPSTREDFLNRVRGLLDEARSK